MAPQKPRKVSDTPKTWISVDTGKRVFATAREMEQRTGVSSEQFSYLVTHPEKVKRCREWMLADAPEIPAVA